MERLGWCGSSSGFFETKANMAGVAAAYAERAGAVVVAPTITSSPFAAGGCWLNGAHVTRCRGDVDRPRGAAGACQRRLRRAVWLPDRFVLSGHSAGGNLALAAAGDLAVGGDIADLRGVLRSSTPSTSPGGSS